MARRKISQDEHKERLNLQLSKAREALQAAEKRLSDLDAEREKLMVKIKERRIMVEKYQALTRESQYSVLDEVLRLKGIDIEAVTKAIANNDMDYLMELTKLKADGGEADSEPGQIGTEDVLTRAIPADQNWQPQNAYTAPHRAEGAETATTNGRLVGDNEMPWLHK